MAKKEAKAKETTKTKKAIAKSKTDVKSEAKTVAVTPRQDKKKLTKRLVKGIQVKIMKGKDKGKIGEVVSFDRKKGKVHVADLNMILDYGRTTVDRVGDKKLVSKPVNVSNIKIVE